MRILLVMDPGILVPPKGYGGHERLVYMLAKEYCQLGHDVHLLVTTGSVVEGCTIHPYGKEGFPQRKGDTIKALLYAWGFLWQNRNQFDLIHNFGRLAFLIPVFNRSVKKIMTYGREIRSRNIKAINKLPHQNLVYTGCSKDLVSRVDAGGKWTAVYNAINFSSYTLQENLKEDAPLIFLGRIERIKGAHTAIAIAKATGNKLILAGNISPLKDEQAYFEQEIKSQIDGIQIQYVGELNDDQKNDWLGKSKALLFPIEWQEPFGIVMAEAMACGTPVIGFNKGSVNEVITEGVTGFKVNNFNEMVAAVQKIDSINRRQCRQMAVKRFDSAVIAKAYLTSIL